MSDASSQAAAWVNRTVVDHSGAKVGTVTDVYVDDQTGQPDWLAVSTGLFGTKVSFVPIDGARDDDDAVVIAFDKDTIKDAPRIDADGALSIEEEQTLYSHYGRSYTPDSARPDMVTPRITSDTSRRDAAMVRSEEELTVGKHAQEVGRVRLRKWVETENVQLTVPVERQVARVVREPAAEDDTPGDLVEGDAEIVLSEEVVDVSKRTVAKERVALDTETATTQFPVNETVRKERVAVEGDDATVDDTEKGAT